MNISISDLAKLIHGKVKDIPPTNFIQVGHCETTYRQQHSYTGEPSDWFDSKEFLDKLNITPRQFTAPIDFFPLGEPEFYKTFSDNIFKATETARVCSKKAVVRVFRAFTTVTNQYKIVVDFAVAPKSLWKIPDEEITEESTIGTTAS